MVSSIKNLKNEIDNRLIAGGLDALACCQLQGAQTILNSSIVTSVASITSLPSAPLNEGRLIYINDINEYRYSDGSEWTDDVTSTSRVYNTQLWAWGAGCCGRLGDGTTTDRCSPVREFYSAVDWRQVSTANQSMAATKSTGQLWSWGRGCCGQLGDGTTVGKCSPVREFCSATDWRQVSLGVYHTAAIKTSGQLWAWGLNTCGRLGDGTTVDRCSPVREFCSATDWCQVNGGGYRNSFAIKTTGQLWSWGIGGAGQLGDGTTVSKCSPVREFCSASDWCRVSGGSAATVAIKTSGQIWTWGLNTCGDIGDGTTVSKCSPVREFCSATDWCGVSSGANHTAAIKTSGQIWTWGRGSCGRLGDGTTTTRCSPVREISSSTDWCQVSGGNVNTYAIKTNGQLWSWGINLCGRLGDGTVTDKCSPVREFSGDNSWCQVSSDLIAAAIKITSFRGFLE